MPSVQQSFRMKLVPSVMGRDVVGVDLRVVRPAGVEVGSADVDERRGGIMRIFNTHLESLMGFGELARQQQLTQIYRDLSRPNILAGLVALDTEWWR